MKVSIKKNLPTVCVCGVAVRTLPQVFSPCASSVWGLGADVVTCLWDVFYHAYDMQIHLRNVHLSTCQKLWHVEELLPKEIRTMMSQQAYEIFCTRPTTCRFLSEIWTCLHVKNVMCVDSSHQKRRSPICMQASPISGNMGHPNERAEVYYSDHDNGSGKYSESMGMVMGIGRPQWVKRACLAGDHKPKKQGYAEVLPAWVRTKRDWKELGLVWCSCYKRVTFAMLSWATCWQRWKTVVWVVIHAKWSKCHQCCSRACSSQLLAWQQQWTCQNKGLHQKPEYGDPNISVIWWSHLPLQQHGFYGWTHPTPGSPFSHQRQGCHQRA
jgi:hypothetical protein